MKPSAMETQLRIRNLEVRMLKQEELSLIRRFVPKIRHNSPISSQPRTPQALKSLFLILCVIGCCYNAFQITSSYLAYDVITESWYYSTEIFTPPLFTFCTKFTNKYNSSYRAPTSSTEFFKDSFSFAEIIQDIRIHIQPIGLTNVKNIAEFERTQVTTFSRRFVICYAINITTYNKTYLRYTSPYLKSQPFPTLLALATNSSACSDERGCQVFTNNVLIRHLPRTGTAIRANGYTYLDYRKEELYLQPRPYITKCRDYKSEGLISQEDCNDICSKKKFLEKYKNVQYESYIYPNENVTVSIDQDDYISSFCEHSCSQVACELHHFSVTSLSATFDANTSLIFFDFPSSSNLKVKYLPKILFWDFLTLFGSVFGLWFGVSTFGLIDRLLDTSFQKSSQVLF